MNILHLANHCDEVGNGIMNVAVDLACHQADLGHKLAFASGGGSFVPLMQQHSVEHFQIEQLWRRPLSLPSAYRKLRDLVRSFQPDIVHAHMMTGALLARAVGPFGRFRLVTTVHNEWQRSAILMAVGERVIAVSEHVRDRMVKRGVSRGKLRVVRNGPLGSPRQRPLPDDAEWPHIDHPAIVTVAGMNERKGIRDLITAFAIVAEDYPRATLYLVGDGPDRKAFEVLANACPCANRIQFTGFVRDPRVYLYKADIFVLASRSDPSPLVIPEARAAGCAIVAAASGGIPEALDGGRAGILVPPLRPDVLASTLRNLLAYPEQRDAWGKCAQINLGPLHVSRTVNETLAVYDELLAEA
jgi:glycosyltransferase involved in cell wall biosynthesis